MIRGRSPPKHRHDGTSPLPLGMDWCPPPKIWNGRDTIWPHDPSSGWSYCVTIPSWVALPKSRSSSSDPVVFFRVQVGIQSPAGITTIRGVLRRFNDFLKLFSDLKKAYSKKTIPSAPPKGLLRMKSRELLDERRCTLEDWISRLLSDIDLSRSMIVASFLELEAAARTSFEEASRQPSEGKSSASSSIYSIQTITPVSGSSSIASDYESVDYGSDTAYETSELGSSSFGRDDSSEAGLEGLTLEEELSNPNIDDRWLMGKSIIDHLEALKKAVEPSQQLTDYENASKLAVLASDKVLHHTRKTSNESIGSDLSSHKGSELPNPSVMNLVGEASLDSTSSEMQFQNDGKVTLLKDQQPKLERILTNMQRRLVTAKTDIEDLISRLDQEVAVKEYLTSKVRDLEVEVETTNEKSKETLQQALSLEKEKIMTMQWNMEELRQKALELELKLKSQEDCNYPADNMRSSSFPEKDELSQDLDAAKDQLKILLKQHEQFDAKSRSDIKVLVKEVKSLRRSQIDIMQKLEESLQEKSEMEQLLQKEMARSQHALAARNKLLTDCRSLHSRLQETNLKFLKNNSRRNSSSVSVVLDLLAESDKQIGILLTEDEHLFLKDDTFVDDDDERKNVDHELRLLLRDIVMNNADLRKKANVVIRSALEMNNEGSQDTISSETVLKIF